MNPERRLVSRRVVVKHHKVGEVRTSDSPNAQYDAMSASKIEETPHTRAYVRPIGLAPPPSPLPPSIPPLPIPSAPIDLPLPQSYLPQLPSHSERSFSHDHTMWFSLGFVFTSAALLYILYITSSFFVPRQYQLMNTSWVFTGVVGELRQVEESGWSLPNDATVLSREERQFGTKSVLVGHDTQCSPVVKKRDVYSHTEQVCVSTIVAWTKPLEIYSHTEELCYDDGTCEEKDVYTKDDAKPIYENKCNPVDRWKSESYVTDECVVVPIYRSDPDMRTFWKYLTWRRMETRTVTLSSRQNVTMQDADENKLGPGEAYMTKKWEYWLHVLSMDNTTTLSHPVARLTYLLYVNRIGEIITLP